MDVTINRLLPKAMQVLVDSGIVVKNHYDKEYKGYISSIGASINQTGLIPTIAFYMNDDGKNASSNNLIDAIHRMIDNGKTDKNLMIYTIKRSRKSGDSERSVYVQELDIDKLFILEDEIEKILVALKQALRTYLPKPNLNDE